MAPKHGDLPIDDGRQNEAIGRKNCQRRPRIRPLIDWHRGAELIAAGTSGAETAKLINCSTRQLSRRRNHDPVFIALVEAMRGGVVEPPPDDPNASLRDRLQDAIEAEVKGGNVRVILWLADRMKLVTPPAEQGEVSDLDLMLDNLSPDEVEDLRKLGSEPVIDED